MNIKHFASPFALTFMLALVACPGADPEQTGEGEGERAGGEGEGEGGEGEGEGGEGEGEGGEGEGEGGEGEGEGEGEGGEGEGEGEETCVPDCSQSTCGNDGCGGSCGTCEDPLVCNIDGAGRSCGCDFFATITYNISLAEGDWSEVFNVTVNVKHIDGEEHPGKGEFLCQRDGCETTSFSAQYHGCQPSLQVRRSYNRIDTGAHCEFDEVVSGTTDITIPLPVFNDAGGCTAPAL